MGPLSVILSKFIGRFAVRSASKEILRTYGSVATKKFFAGLSDDFLATASKQDIISLARETLSSTAKDQALKNIFSKSNAKKLADILNKGTDVVEARTRKFLEGQSLRLLNQRLVDALGRSGVDASGRRLVGKTRSRTYTRARGFASDTLEAALFPQSPKQAFGSAYARGVIGEATSTWWTSLLTGIPRTAINTPRIRTFIRYMQQEVNYLRTVGQVRNASQLNKAIKKAAREARGLYGVEESYAAYSVAGYISGRLTVPLATTYVFVDEDERKKNIDKFQRSIKPFAQKKVKTYVDSYIRSDGTRVKGHYRELVAA